MDFDFNCKNKYYTLYSRIRDDILKGKYKKGEKLPSKRALAARLGVSVITVQLAYEQLLAEGYVVSRERSGYFVEEAQAPYYATVARSKSVKPESAEKFKVDLVKGNIPAELFPFSVWSRLIRGVLADCGEHLLERVPCDGDGELKESISDYLYRSRGIDADPRYIIVGAGAEHLYGVIVQLLGRDKLYAVENPVYKKIPSAYSLNGAKFVPVSVTERGMDLSALEKSGADVAHVSPSHQYPTGAVMPVSARTRLIAWANGGERFIIEDDYDSEFRLSGKPLQSTYSLCPDKVIYMNTFSKSLAPSMRLGYMILPPKLFERYLKLFSSSANIVPLFEQKTLSEMLSGGYLERHISRLRKHYRNIRMLLLKALEGLCEVNDTGSGLHLTAKFYNASSDEEIKRKAAERGVNIKCLSDYLLSPLDGTEKCAVINYSGLREQDFK